VAEAAAAAGLCAGYVLTTATADWTTYETIGGLKPTQDNRLTFAPGHFLEAIEQNKWLVIDELNRSNFDRAFGQLFTVLSGQAV
jgi:dynein-related subfamily AAA family protein